MSFFLPALDLKSRCFLLFREKVNPDVSLGLGTFRSFIQKYLDLLRFYHFLYSCVSLVSMVRVFDTYTHVCICVCSCVCVMTGLEV